MTPTLPPSLDAHAAELASRLIGRWTGLDLRSVAPQRVESLLQTRAEHLGYRTVSGYLEALESHAPDALERERLINLITNGVTMFWRDEPQLHALAAVLEHLARRTPHRPISIWCAGCSTGEEAYTVAMIARELGAPAHVLGTDLNTDSLAHARQGVFDAWSLRRLSATRREAYFDATPDGRWRVRGALREIVTFRHHNLLDPPPSPPAVAGPHTTADARCWDVILCRNVMIYFAPQATRTVHRHFASVLDADGYLLLGSSEQIHDADDHAPPFRAARQAEGFVYRLSATRPGRTIFPSLTGSPIDGLLPGESLRDAMNRAQERAPDVPAEPVGLEEDTLDWHDQTTVAELLQAGVAHLSGGRPEEAMALFEAALSYDPFVAEAYCLLGSALRDNGAPRLAAEAFGKALFLEPHNWYAAFELALLHHTGDQHARAHQAFRQTLEGLAHSPDPLVDHHALRRLIGPLEAARQRIERHVAQQRERPAEKKPWWQE